MLPTEKTKAKQSLNDLKVLIYGAPKLGKSTWCSQIDHGLFFATEQGLGALDVFKVDVPSWESLLKHLGEVAEGKHQFKTIILDTIDNAFRFCSEYICAKHNIAHESDLGYGKGWALVSNEFVRVLNKIAHLPYGLVLVSHAQDIELKTPTGSRHKMVPTLPDKPRRLIHGFVDMILYCDIEYEKQVDETTIVRRILRTKPSVNYEAGDRTGRLPETLPLSYLEFLKAFNTSQNQENKASIASPKPADGGEK